MTAPVPPKPAWTFRGNPMSPEEFSASMTEFYRGEMQRANIWRTRLDTTTNWAVITTAATILAVFGSVAYHYSVIILSTFIVSFCLWMEARRYRYYELWSYRVRLMETDFFAAMLVPPFAPSPEWAENLAESLLQPSFSISMWEAFGRRFRRNYIWLLSVLGLAWGLKIFLHPTPATTWDDFVMRAAFGPISGGVMLSIGLAYNGLLFLVGLATAWLKRAPGEVLPKFGDFPILSDLWTDGESGEKKDDSAVFLRRRQQLLTLIVTAKPQAVADRIMKDMKRGVTSLHGQGMYTQQERPVLMVAVMVTEMARLKTLVQAEDPNAFVIVTPAQAIFGRGFQPLGA